jgi:hypothetical protein
MGVFPTPSIRKMKKRPNTQSFNATGNYNDNKFKVLMWLREGLNRKDIETKLGIGRTTVLGHIRDLKKEGIVKEGTVFFYPLTPKGFDITYEEFNKIFYPRAGCRGAVEIEVDKRTRFHDLFFVTYLIKRPEKLPTHAVLNDNLKNSKYHTIQYETGYIRVHTKKVILQVDDFTAPNAFDGSFIVSEKLRKLIKEAAEDGFIFDKTYHAISYHIAKMWHPLASAFKTKGHAVLVEDRLIIDFSHAVPEFETINKHLADEDMRKMEIIHKAFLDSPMNNAEMFATIYRNIDLLLKKDGKQRK